MTAERQSMVNRKIDSQRRQKSWYFMTPKESGYLMKPSRVKNEPLRGTLTLVARNTTQKKKSVDKFIFENYDTLLKLQMKMIQIT